VVQTGWFRQGGSDRVVQTSTINLFYSSEGTIYRIGSSTGTSRPGRLGRVRQVLAGISIYSILVTYFTHLHAVNGSGERQRQQVRKCTAPLIPQVQVSATCFLALTSSVVWYFGVA
jgi:hypothetical protein